MSPCPRPALARCYSPPRWPPWDEGAALPFPPGTASPHRALLETCALHRASLHCAASPCGSPSLLSLPAASGQREGSQSACAVLLVACHCLPISRVLAVDRSTLPWLCCKPRLAEASPRPHLSYLAASHSACAAACSALHVRPAAATHLRIPVTLLASLCAPAAEVILPICGHLWAPSLRLPCSRSCSARSLCLCAAGRWQPLSATPTLWEWVRAGMS